MANDIKLKIGADTSEIEKAFGNLIKKIQGDADKLKLTPTAKATAPGIDAVRDAAQTNRSMGQKVREEKAGLDLINRELSKKKNLIEEIAKRQEMAVKGSREELALAQRLNKEKERLQQTEKVAQIQKENYRKVQEASDRASGSNRGPGGLPPSSGGMMGTISRVAGAVVGGVGIGATAVASMEGIRKFFDEAENRSRTNNAAAFNMQGQGGQRLGSILNGNASEEMLFNPLRMEAAKIADATMKQRLESQFRIIARPTETIFGRASSHSTNNAIPGAFTIDQFGLGTENAKKDIESRQYRERTTLQAEQFEGLKNGPENSLFTNVGNKYLKDYQRDLDFQRQMGLNTNTFRGQFQSPTGQFTGGFLNNVQSAGFTTEQGMGMASGIMGAGGSTRSAVGNAGFGLQMQKQFDLTNVDKVLGALSGRLGSSEMSKEGLIKIQAEGTRIGLNQSEFREENRKFVQMAADVISKSNVTSGAGIDQLVDTFSKFMGDKTTTGMEAGRNAYEAYQRQSNVQTGPSAAMRAAGMMKNPILRKLSGEDQAALFTMSQADVNPDDLGIQAMARKVRKTPQEFVDAYHDVQNSSLFQRKSSDMALSKLSKAYKTGASISPEDRSRGVMGPGTEELEGETLNKMPLEEAARGLDRKGQLALVRARGQGDTKEISRLLEEGVKTQAATGQTGRPEDETNKLQAEASRMANQLFMSIKDSIVPASDAAQKFANDINNLTAAMRAGTPKQIGEALKNFQSGNSAGYSPVNQPSAGPPANGASQGSR